MMTKLLQKRYGKAVMEKESSKKKWIIIEDGGYFPPYLTQYSPMHYQCALSSLKRMEWEEVTKMADAMEQVTP